MCNGPLRYDHEASSIQTCNTIQTSEEANWSVKHDDTASKFTAIVRLSHRDTSTLA